MFPDESSTLLLLLLFDYSFPLMIRNIANVNIHLVKPCLSLLYYGILLKLILNYFVSIIHVIF